MQEAIGYHSGRARLCCSNKQVQNLSNSTTKNFFTIILHIQVVLLGWGVGFTYGSHSGTQVDENIILIRPSMIIKAMGKGHWESHMSNYIFFMEMTETTFAHISLTKRVIHLFPTYHVPRRRSIRIFVGIPSDYHYHIWWRSGVIIIALIS